jgi:PAS domain S-box-containing protein
LALHDPSRFRLLADVWNDATTAACVYDLDGRYLEVNERWCELFGYSREEMLAMRAGDLTVEADRPGPELFAQILEEGELVAEGVARRKDGSLVPLKFRASRRRVGDGYLILVAVWPR